MNDVDEQVEAALDERERLEDLADMRPLTDHENEQLRKVLVYLRSVGALEDL